MKRSISEKMLSQKQKNKNNEKRIAKKSRFLITVNVLGSTGPLRFLVNEGDSVSCVIDSALKFFASEGRLPTLGSDLNNILLYPANSGSDSTLFFLDLYLIFHVELFRGVGLICYGFCLIGRS